MGKIGGQRDELESSGFTRELIPPTGEETCHAMVKNPFENRRFANRGMHRLCGRAVDKSGRRGGTRSARSGVDASWPVSRVLYDPAFPPDVTAIRLGRPLPDASSNQPGQRRGNTPGSGEPVPAVPIRSCSRWGLPCRLRRRRPRCALTAPFHPYPWAKARRRFAFCGTFPGVAPAGRYPAPCFHGARTFLDGGALATKPSTATAAVRPAGTRR